MNIINVNIDFKNGTCEKTGISVVTGDYNSTKIVFEFNEEAVGTKMFELKNPSDELVYVDEIIDNEVILVGTEEVEGEEQIYSLFNEEGDYTFEVSLYGADSKLTSVCDYITARKEQVIIDEKVVEEYIPTFELLLNQITEKILEVDNLDIDSEKVGTTATITITRKDGTTKQTAISDGINGVDGKDGRDGRDGINGRDGLNGVGLEYDWSGTSLGIKREDEQDYDYVNLKGEKGDKGNDGSTGASNVLSIGIVESGDVASATITGTSPSQVLNLVLPKGDKGNTGSAGRDGATGNGISNIEKTSTSGLVDTYTIAYTDGTSDTFTITNGEDGQNGTNGTDGVGISNIQKTSTSGLVDTYTITYTNGNSTTYEITNGTNGTNGQDGYTPVRGVDYWTSNDIATIESYCDTLVLGALNQSY